MMGTETAARFEERYEMLRLKEAEHRHANTLQLLSNLVRRSLSEAEGAEAREALASVHELVQTLGKLHRLSREGEDDPAHVLTGMCQHWQRMCNGHIRIELETEGALDRLKGRQTVVLLIAQELVLNAIKHAFPENRRGKIRIALACGDEVTLRVEDDGVGLGGDGPGDGDAHQGSALVRDLSRALGGTARAGPGGHGTGHCVTLRWPL